ncbi:DUF1330 domain-containing protein [Aquibaculum sediminis]|uniref:DUF1330 domain-containing protein n=1 Tax=Aquibaculum sediminis TaxID=3231907 RepID=UPI0034541F72
MPAYWIAHVKVTDPERYRGYTELAPAAFSRHGARFLARGGESETFEGTAYERQVVIEFPDLESARACYRSPEYQAAKAKRDGACVAHVSIVAGL